MFQMATVTTVNEEEIVKLFDKLSNKGRWGDNDERGTLNYITPEKRKQAAALVQRGEALSIARPLSTQQTRNNPRPVVHIMGYERHSEPISALDFIGIWAHGFTTTHLDAIAHVYWQGQIYNGRKAEDVVTQQGLTFGSLYAQRNGIFTRGVLLDLARARGVEWLPPWELIMPEDLEKAEQYGHVQVESGDAIFLRVGVEARELVEGPEDIGMRAGVGPEVVEWLHEREVAVYSGDCVDYIPYPSKRVPLPLHQLGLVALGLVLLDIPTVEELARTCKELDRYEFLLTCAPLALPGATGSAVNPIVVF
jgi:kynurenine formamidase